MTDGVPDAVIERLKEAAGARGWIDGDGVARYLVDERDLYHGRSPLVLRPDSTEAVAAIVRLCGEAGVGVVPQGGNTGYCGGSVPGTGGDEVVLSLERMNRIRDIDPTDYTMTVEAGCVLAEVQAAACAADRLFPLSLAAEGTCQIGGVLSTNAGGVNVLRYGNARHLALGIEVVLADGRIWNGLSRLRKDNTGYHLKELFLGAEGTLGIITAAVLELFPRPVQTAVAWAAVDAPATATDLLARLRAASDDRVTSFEYVQRSGLDLVLGHVDGAVDPMDGAHGHYVLIELSSGRDDGSLVGILEEVLAAGYESGGVQDAVVAQNEQQAADLWSLREHVPEAQKRAGGSVKHDVSVPVSRVSDFLAEATALAEGEIPGVRVVAFGHLGDGNVHFNLSPPVGADFEPFRIAGDALTPRIHDLALGMGGSFSAEHGIGQLKRDEMARLKAPPALALMAGLKRLLDPAGMLNRGKVLPEGAGEGRR